MKYQCIITDLAEADLADAQTWYEERQAGLGNDFLQAIRRKIHLLSSTPEMHAYWLHPLLRRGKLADFPYSTYYRLLDQQTVEIMAVLHDHQDSNPILRKRL